MGHSSDIDNQQAQENQTRAPLIVILAAGRGKRMKSPLAKPMHPIGNRPLIGHALSLANSLNPQTIACILGPDMPEVEAYVSTYHPKAHCFFQPVPLGTADALRAASSLWQPAKTHSASLPDDVIVLFVDSPGIDRDMIGDMRLRLSRGDDFVLLGFRADDAASYGEILIEDGQPVGICEARERSEPRQGDVICNSGAMGFRREALTAILPKIGNDNASGEYYLTDSVAIGLSLGFQPGLALGAQSALSGINNCAELARAEAYFQASKRSQFLASGVAMTAPDTVFFSADTEIGAGSFIEPHVIFGTGMQIGSNVSILAYSHLTGSKIADGAKIGPFARLRPGTEIGAGAKIGNYTELKNAKIGVQGKIGHVSYIGDSVIGERANIGAGTVICNYDGMQKFSTEIGDQAFIGSNATLVAPLKIGAQSYIAAGSTITRDVEAGSLSFGRAQQIDKPRKQSRETPKMKKTKP